MKEDAVCAVCREENHSVNWEYYFVQGFEVLFLGIGSYLDIKNREIPMEFLAAFGCFGILCNMVLKYQSMKNIISGISIGIFFLLIGWVTKEAIGYGDGLGLCVLGLFEGWSGMIPLVFGAFLLSSVYGIWRIIGFREQKGDTMPFYPFLFLAFMGVIVL